MHYPNLSALIADSKSGLSKGPVALIMIEDEIEIDSTLAHLAQFEFGLMIAFCAADITLPDGDYGNLHRVDYDVSADLALQTVVNGLMKVSPGTWFNYCYNAEYLYYPFCESRNIKEVLSFMQEERRDTIMSYVVDLYAQDLGTHPSGVHREEAYFDQSGYYALPCRDKLGEVLDRQLEVSGGLRWRFEEHIPKDRQRTDRVSFFRAKAGVEMLPDRTFNDPEYNTISCPWHNNLTAAVASFRTAKALRRNPGSRDVINTFHWPQSQKFNWHSQQLLDLGLMEPGQWF